MFFNKNNYTDMLSKAQINKWWKDYSTVMLPKFFIKYSGLFT